LRMVADGCGWLRTVADSCDCKRNVERTPRVKREPLLRIRENTHTHRTFPDSCATLIRQSTLLKKKNLSPQSATIPLSALSPFCELSPAFQTPPGRVSQVQSKPFVMYSLYNLYSLYILCLWGNPNHFWSSSPNRPDQLKISCLATWGFTGNSAPRPRAIFPTE
jgi:hypothetical protein